MNNISNISMKRKADQGSIDSMEVTSPTVGTSFGTQNKRPRHGFETRTQNVKQDVNERSSGKTSGSFNNSGCSKTHEYSRKSLEFQEQLNDTEDELTKFVEKNSPKRRNKENHVNRKLETKQYLSVEDNSVPMNQFDKPMSFDEKLQLKRQLIELSGDDLDGAVDILHSRKPSFVDLDDVRIDLNTLELSILRELQLYVASCQKEEPRSSVQHVDVAPVVNPVVCHSPAPPLTPQKASVDKVRLSTPFAKNVKQRGAEKVAAKTPTIVRKILPRQTEICGTNEPYGSRKKPTVTEIFQKFKDIRKAKDEAKKQRALLKEQKMSNRQKK